MQPAEGSILLILMHTQLSKHHLCLRVTLNNQLCSSRAFSYLLLLLVWPMDSFLVVVFILAPTDILLLAVELAGIWFTPIDMRGAPAPTDMRLVELSRELAML